MSGPLHLIKLCVGVETLDDLGGHIDRRIEAQRDIEGRMETTHVTRMWPKREAELLDGGSLYWVIRGTLQARQAILRLDEQIGTDGIRRCAIRLSPELIRTSPAPRRPFQGWRYLKASDAPKDLGSWRSGEETMPQDMQEELSRLGVL